MPEYNLKDKVIIITGASSGLGAAIAEAFASEGSQITITGRNASRLQEVAKKCQDIGLPESNILTLIVDHSKEEDNEKTVSEAISKFGQLDVLVNNAGILLMSTTESTSKEEYDQIMDINIRAPFKLTQLAIPHLRKTKGNIVNISSLTSYAAMKGSVSYGMTKAALDNLTRSSCLELAADGVRVNSVNPGYVATNVFRRGQVPDARVAEVEEDQSKRHPLGRNGRPREVADAVLFLASARASFITGVTLPVDGGRVAQLP